MYDDPSYEIYRKHLSVGLILNSKTSCKIPTSPRGRWFFAPPVHIQTGGQLGTPLNLISGWSRSDILGSPFVKGFPVARMNQKPDHARLIWYIAGALVNQHPV
jgi:hypothetical protein